MFPEKAGNGQVELKLPCTMDHQGKLREKLGQYLSSIASSDRNKVFLETSQTTYSIVILQEVLKGCPVKICELQERLEREQPLFIKQNFDGAVKIVTNWLSNEDAIDRSINIHNAEFFGVTSST